MAFRELTNRISDVELGLHSHYTYTYEEYYDSSRYNAYLHR